MTAVLVRSAAEGHRRSADSRPEAAAARVRLIKIVCAVLLGIAFWFAVPYSLPLKVDANPMKAAADEAAAYQGNLSREIAMPAILMIATYMLWKLPKRGRIARGSKLMVLAAGYAGWAATSFCWSVDPAMSRKRLIVFAVNLVVIYGLARCASMFEVAIFGFASTGVVALISLGVDVVVQHRFAPLNPDYRFTGVMTANFQAMNLVVCLLCGLTVVQARPRWMNWMVPLLMLLAGLLVLTKARVGTFLFAGMLVFSLGRIARRYLRPRVRSMLLTGGLLLVFGAAGIAALHSGPRAFTEVFMMGRRDTQNTASLSNRAPLWAELMGSVREHPVLGFGYGAFWTPARVRKISLDQGWMVPHGHNTYLDETLSLGAVGAVLYTCVLLGGCVLAWRRYRRLPDEGSALVALLLTWLALLGLSESVPVAPNLPTLIAYACLVKLFLVEGSDDAGQGVAGGGRFGRERLWVESSRGSRVAFRGSQS